MKNILRTPESRFDNLKDYPFQPNYLNISELRMHYVDEGPRDGQIVLMLHGEPTWSYLYRFMIPICAKAGLRVIAPDLIGFGKSDKLAKISDYSYEKHVSWMKKFIDELDLENITLFGQDWGSLIGLRLAMENEQRFARIVIGNGALPTGTKALPLPFKLWQAFARYTPYFPAAGIVQAASLRWLNKEERRAYKAPFPNNDYHTGTRNLPIIVPNSKDDPAHEANKAAWDKLKQWTKPFLTIYGQQDPILRWFQDGFINKVPGAKGLNHQKIRGGHFIQEDQPEILSQGIIDLINAT